MTASIPALTVRQVCAQLRVSKSTVYKWLRSGLRSLKLGKLRRVRQTDLERWLERHKAG